MLSIHSETFCLLALAAAVIRLTSSALKRTGMMRPLASPFGSWGRPIFFLVLFCWLKASKLLYDRGKCGILTHAGYNSDGSNHLIAVTSYGSIRLNF